MSETERAPFIGPRPYEAAEHELFYGRARDIADLVSLVIANKCVLLYSPSGAGKTSIINAGLVPQLEASGLLAVKSIRVSLYSDAVARNDISALLGTPDTANLSPTLWVFDQFEEIFSLKTNPKDRKAFFVNLGEFFESVPLGKALIAMREEWLAEINDYSDFLPADLACRLRLESMGVESATSIIRLAFAEFGVKFEMGVVEGLVTELVDKEQHVEPVQLQVVCLELWNSIDSRPFTVTENFRKRHAIIAKALERYYERALLAISIATGCRLSAMRRWFDTELITPSKTRGLAWRGQGGVGAVSDRAIELLESNHLVRAEIRGQDKWYELSHDRLIEPILTSNTAWRVRQRAFRVASLVALLASGVAVLAIFTFVYFRATRRAEVARDDAIGKTLMLEIQRAQAVNRNDELSLLLIKAAALLSPAAPQAQDVMYRVLNSPYLVTPLDPGIGAIQASAWSPSGNQIAFAGQNGVVSIWQVYPTRSEVRRFDCLDKACVALGWDRSSGMLAVGGNSGILTVWNVAGDSKPIIMGHAHRGAIETIAWYPASMGVATGGADGKVLFWSLTDRTGSPLILLSSKGRIAALACSNKGQLAAGDFDRKLWVSRSLKGPTRMLGRFRSPVLSVAWSADERLVSGGGDDTVRLWNVSEGTEVGKYRMNHGRVHSVAWSSEGEVYAWSADQNIRVWDMNRDPAEPSRTYSAGGSEIRLAFSAREDLALLSKGAFSIGFWRKNATALPDIAGSLQSSVTTLQLLAEGETVAAGAQDGTVAILPRTSSTKSISRVLVSTIAPVRAISASDDYVIAAGAYSDGSGIPRGPNRGVICLWQPSEAPTKSRINAKHRYLYESEFTSMVADYKRRIIYAGTASGEVLPIDFSGKQLVRIHPPIKVTVKGVVALRLDGRGILWCADRSARQWTIDPSVYRVTATGADISCRTDTAVAAMHSNSQIAIGCNLQISVRSGTGPTPPVEISLPARVTALDWAQDGKLLAYGTEFGGVGVIDVERARRENRSTSIRGVPFPAHRAQVNTVLWSSSGRVLATGSADNTILRWSSLRIFGSDPCEFVGRDITPSEWALSVGHDVPFRSVCASQGAVRK